MLCFFCTPLTYSSSTLLLCFLRHRVSQLLWDIKTDRCVKTENKMCQAKFENTLIIRFSQKRSFKMFHKTLSPFLEFLCIYIHLQDRLSYLYTVHSTCLAPVSHYFHVSFSRCVGIWDLVCYKDSHTVRTSYQLF